MEQYILEVARVCSTRGYRTIVQYESMPQSKVYLADLRSLGASAVVLPTAERRADRILSLWKLFRSLRPQVIQTHFSERHVVASAGTIARAMGTRRVVCMVHSVFGLTRRSVARHAFNRCDNVLGVSEAVRRDLIAGAVRPEIIATHYLGILGDRQPSETVRQSVRKEFEIPRGAFVLGNIAFDAPVKGVDVLLHALRRAVESRPDVQLIQVGVDPATSKLPKLAADLGIAANVHWAGIRDNGWRLLNAVDVYIQPSRAGEGLPLAIMEAMALRLPVIASRSGGNDEAVQDGLTGKIVNADNPSALADAIDAMAADTHGRRVYGDRGFERFTSRFDGRASAADLVGKYYF